MNKGRAIFRAVQAATAGLENGGDCLSSVNDETGD
jgi:hypothetical protein